MKTRMPVRHAGPDSFYFCGSGTKRMAHPPPEAMRICSESPATTWRSLIATSQGFVFQSAFSPSA